MIAPTDEPLLAHAVEKIGEARGRLGIGTEERIALHLGPIPGGAIDRLRSHLDQRGAHIEAGHDLAGDGAGRHPHRGLARRGAAAAAVVVEAVFGVIGVAGVARPIDVLDGGIVLRALIDVLDQQRDRRAGRDLLAGRLVGEHAGEDFDRVRFLPLGGEAGLAGPPLVQIGLDVGLAQRNARWTTIDHAADRRPVAFAKGRDPEEMAEGIE